MLFKIEKLEQELNTLNEALKSTSDKEERVNILHCIQDRNLQLSRLYAE